MIIDSHHHLWKFSAGEYPWIDESMEVLRRDYLPQDLLRESETTGTEGTVVIQARQNMEETRWLLDLAGKHPFIRGVVGWVDLRSPVLQSQLEEFAGKGKLVGVRHVIQDEPDEGFMLLPQFVRGIGMLREQNLVYDLLLFPRHLVHAVKLVGMFPDQRFVLDHMAKPCIASGALQPWKDHIESLAALPNVWCKISGMVTEADRKVWKYEDFIPYMEVVTRAFGIERIMLGSDWPVCRLAGEYEEVLGIPLRYFSGFSRDSKERIYRSNAMECYQLDI